MPNLEAPAGFQDSSPERSLTPALAGPESLEIAADLQRAHNHAIVQIRVQAAEAQAQPASRNRASFDRDIALNEEDNHWPTAAVHLLPVTLPPAQVSEPTLDELLQRVTERNDLQNVQSIRLRVISYTISLSRLSLFLPCLQHLNLSGSVLGSLRDLGFGLTNLTFLNVSNCGLNSFDGTSGLPAIQELIADGNMIQRVGPLSELPMLQRLSAQHNRISELGLLSFLGMCPNLMEVQLQGNPVCYLSLYRSTLQRSVPTLVLLDGAHINELSSNNLEMQRNEMQHCQNVTSTDGESELSSLSSERHTQLLTTSSLSSEADTEDAKPMLLNDRDRPATAPTLARNLVLLNNNRSASAISERGNRQQSSLTQGALVVGSVLSLARRARRQRNITAWTSTNSSSNSTSISETEAVFSATDQAPMSGTCISNCSSPEPSSSSEM